MVIYLDDMLLLGATPTSLARDTNVALELLQRLGFQINWKKSVIEPTQKLEFLGWIINTNPLEISLPVRKREDIKRVGTSLLERKNVTTGDLAAGLGKLQAAEEALPHARLHYRNTQIYLIRKLGIKSRSKKLYDLS